LDPRRFSLNAVAASIFQKERDRHNGRSLNRRALAFGNDRLGALPLP
jgi:hypothetical protein